MDYVCRSWQLRPGNKDPAALNGPPNSCRVIARRIPAACYCAPVEVTENPTLEAVRFLGLLSTVMHNDEVRQMWDIIPIPAQAIRKGSVSYPENSSRRCLAVALDGKVNALWSQQQWQTHLAPPGAKEARYGISFDEQSL
jgi:hypothetical protein